MTSNTIDAKMLSKMFLAGAKNLESKKEWINELNVFPVPDGDTGTNMTMTIMSAAREVSALGENADMTALCKAVSSGFPAGSQREFRGHPVPASPRLYQKHQRQGTAYHPGTFRCL